MFIKELINGLSADRLSYGSFFCQPVSPVHVCCGLRTHSKHMPVAIFVATCDIAIVFRSFCMADLLIPKRSANPAIDISEYICNALSTLVHSKVVNSAIYRMFVLMSYSCILCYNTF
ncbi:MAG: hypothetical protein MJZ41_10160 [Bacteroidaceae bacterium]|nr:hypothetical protein [Bacteroidaceae bacterium]